MALAVQLCAAEVEDAQAPANRDANEAMGTTASRMTAIGATRVAMRAALTTLTALTALTVLATEARAEPRAVIELFTSQGCSSCPPADKLLGELKNNPDLIAVSLPIHYWDYLGWKDTLADPRHTARQRAYSVTRGDREVYTPQVVVNGAAQALGSDRAAIEQAIAAARSQGAALSAPLDIRIADGEVSVTAGESKSGGGEVWLWGLASAVPVAIRRGENNGRTVTYANVVRRWLKLGDWSGEARRWSVPLADIKADQVDAVAVIVQSGSAAAPGPIIGARLAALH